jgi:TPR repeat protein
LEKMLKYQELVFTLIKRGSLTHTDGVVLSRLRTAETMAWVSGLTPDPHGIVDNELAEHCMIWHRVELAKDFWKKAEVMGLPEATNALATLAENPVDAFNGFFMAAKRGCEIAYVNLAICYEKGHGIAQNYETALEYYIRARHLGEALYAIGRFALYGRGMQRDKTTAFRNFQAAADQGFIPAVYALGEMYRTGCGVEKNMEMAVDLYKRLDGIADYGDRASMRVKQIYHFLTRKSESNVRRLCKPEPNSPE